MMMMMMYELDYKKNIIYTYIELKMIKMCYIIISTSICGS